MRAQTATIIHLSDLHIDMQMLASVPCAALDEVRHARLCLALAGAYGGAAQALLSGVC